MLVNWTFHVANSNKINMAINHVAKFGFVNPIVDKKYLDFSTEMSEQEARKKMKELSLHWHMVFPYPLHAFADQRLLVRYMTYVGVEFAEGD